MAGLVVCPTPRQHSSAGVCENRKSLVARLARHQNMERSRSALWACVNSGTSLRGHVKGMWRACEEDFKPQGICHGQVCASSFPYLYLSLSKINEAGLKSWAQLQGQAPSWILASLHGCQTIKGLCVRFSCPVWTLLMLKGFKHRCQTEAPSVIISGRYKARLRKRERTYWPWPQLAS